MSDTTKWTLPDGTEVGPDSPDGDLRFGAAEAESASDEWAAVADEWGITRRGHPKGGRSRRRPWPHLGHAQGGSMSIKWRAIYEPDACPVPVECEPGAKSDADGFSIYENSHFDSATEAWECLERNALSMVARAGARITDAEKGLALLRADAGEAAKAYDHIRRRGVEGK